jgi:pimeloyl-ACP methyl ester carboxylesterase
VQPLDRICPPTDRTPLAPELPRHGAGELHAARAETREELAARVDRTRTNAEQRANQLRDRAADAAQAAAARWRQIQDRWQDHVRAVRAQVQDKQAERDAKRAERSAVVSEDEAKQLYATYAVPGSGAPLFESAAANLNPWTEAKVDTNNPDRGPLLLIEGEQDHTVPWAVANAAYRQQQDNEGVTEIAEIKNRGHSLTIDSGWREVADTALAFVQRFT